VKKNQQCPAVYGAANLVPIKHKYSATIMDPGDQHCTIEILLFLLP